jgi:hypothetical protein
VQYYYGGAFSLLGRYSEAEERLQRGLNQATERNDLGGQIWFLRAIGRVAAKQEQWPAAEAAFQREVDACRRKRIDCSGAQAELDAARQHRMVPRSEQPNGWL